MIRQFFRTFAVSMLALLASSATGAELSVKTADQPAPSQISEPIRGVLAPKAIQLVDGDKPVLQIWFRQEVPLKSQPKSPGSSLDSLAETTLVGAVSVEGAGLKDYKENPVPKGVFTAHFALQPQDGDHLGTAEFNYFLVLVSAEVDKAVDTIKRFTALTKASGKLTTSGHPVIISLRPVSSAEGNFPSLTAPAAEHKAIRLKIPGKTAAGEKSDVLFDLVYQGHGHIQ